MHEGPQIGLKILRRWKRHEQDAEELPSSELTLAKKKEQSISWVKTKVHETANSHARIAGQLLHKLTIDLIPQLPMRNSFTQQPPLFLQNHRN